MLLKKRGNKITRYDAFRTSLSRELKRQMCSLEKDFPNIEFPDYPVQVHITEGLGAKCDVEFRRIDDEIHIAISPIFSAYLYKGLWNSVVANYFWFASCSPDVRVLLVNVSDGERPSLAHFSASTYSKKVTTLPDFHFFFSRGYRDVDDLLSKDSHVWAERSDDIVWRGSAFGNGYMNFDIEMADNPMVMQRIRFAQKAKGSDVDFRFVEHSLTKWYYFPMEKSGLMGQRVEEFSWMNRKYAIDIDGFSNAWSNFYIRLKLGCCVLKVESDFGFRQWYYDKLIPFEHYVPIRADLSDLFEQVEWVRANQSQAQEIAAAGQAVVNSMTFESETTEAVRRITENWNK